MTPTHPTRIGTHRRIADAIEAGANEVSGIAARLGMTPASIGIALHLLGIKHKALAAFGVRPDV